MFGSMPQLRPGDQGTFQVLFGTTDLGSKRSKRILAWSIKLLLADLWPILNPFGQCYGYQSPLSYRMIGSLRSGKRSNLDESQACGSTWGYSWGVILPYIEKNHPNWPIFFSRGVETTNQTVLRWIYLMVATRQSLRFVFPAQAGFEVTRDRQDSQSSEKMWNCQVNMDPERLKWSSAG